ncbi:MAG TPA: hypothetical protein PLQ20_01610 [Candidatus Paceibacterota bacterium]|jgi:hypothetical protein|nr:hypothetical protein [Candidatus Paceibacterota bacterium]
MDILSKLFGGVARVKIMRLFLLNPEQGFETSTISERSRLSASVARQAVNQMASMSLVKKRSFIKETVDGRTGKIKKKRVQGWFLNPDFPYIKELRALLIEGDFFKHDELVKRFRPAGKIQMLVVSGVFMKQSGSRLDILIVGDNISKKYIQKAVAVLESELGSELSYAVFDNADFRYRVSMYDKLLRDMFEYPHERLLASKEFSTFVFPN